MAEIVVEYDYDAADVKQATLIEELLDKELIAKAADELKRLPLQGTVKLTLSARYDYTVGKRMDSGGTPLRLPSERLLRMAAGAKAIAGGPEGGEIVIQARLFLEGDEEGRRELGLDPQRIVAHEGWHAVLQQHSEDPLSVFKGLQPPPPDEAHQVQLACFYLDEYRVELALCEKSTRRLFGRKRFLGPVERKHDEEMFLDGAVRELRAAPLEVRPGDHPSRSGLGLCYLFGQRFAFISAEENVTHEPMIERGKASPAYGLAKGFWNQLVEMLGPVPSARFRLTSDEIEVYVRQLSAVAYDWMTGLRKYVPAPGIPLLEEWPSPDDQDKTDPVTE